MKRLKNFTLILVLLIIPCAFMFFGCNFFSDNTTGTYVVKIEEAETHENYTIYTITYSDGTTSNFSVKNGVDGQDGADGKDVTIQDIYDAYVKNNTGTTLTFDEFLDYYLKLEVEKTNIKTATNKALMSAVSVYASYNSTTSFYTGGGVIYKMFDDYSYIITNYHVIFNEKSPDNISNNIFVFQYGVDNSAMVYCEYVGGSLTYDIAILKCETSELLENNPYATPVEIASSYFVADTAIAIGNPEGDGISVTKGIVSVDSEIIPIKAVDNSSTINFRVIRIDTSVNGGNSGGGLFNEKGQLIGIVNAKLLYSSSSDPIDNISYALPCDNVVKVADNILFYSAESDSSSDYTSVKKLILGTTITAQNSKCVFDNDELYIVEDAVITDVVEDGLAESIGFKVGDIVKSVKINEKQYSITRYFQLSDLMLTVREDDRVEFVVERNGEKIALIINSVSASNITVIK